MTRVTKRACIAILLSLSLAGAAVAQVQQQAPNPDLKPDPKSCANNSGSSGDLSNKLSQSNGVICPPDIDQGMKAPTPDTGKMPVIPPPGSPGGDQSVEPK
jgi:hypothetical protein